MQERLRVLSPSVMDGQHTRGLVHQLGFAVVTLVVAKAVRRVDSCSGVLLEQRKGGPRLWVGILAERFSLTWLGLESSSGWTCQGGSAWESPALSCGCWLLLARALKGRDLMSDPSLGGGRI